MYSILGVIEGLVLIFLVFFLSTNNLKPFLQLNSIFYMSGGILALCLMTFSFSEVIKAFKHFFISLMNEKLYSKHDKDEILRVARTRYRNDPFALEKSLEDIKSPFLKTGVQLMIDKVPLEETLNLLNWRIKRLADREESEAEIFSTLAKYTLTVSILAALIELSNITTANPVGDLLTLQHILVVVMPIGYGVFLANLVLKPMALKLRRRTQHRLEILGMVQESIAIMYTQHRPGLIKETLRSFSSKVSDEF
jgi:chemotaxis protein MotA